MKRNRKPPTEEQKEFKNKKAREKRANMTEAEKALFYEKRKEKYANLPPDIKEKYVLKQKEKYEKIKNTPKEKQRRAEYAKKYKLKNKERLKENTKNWHNEKLKTDEVYKAKVKSRAMIKDAMRRMGYSKKATATQILGCSFEAFKTYLESKFEPWMDWDNYGLYNGEPNYGWDIDHIKPLSKGQSVEEVHELNHFTNLQPLCSYVNRDVKNSSFDRLPFFHS